MLRSLSIAPPAAMNPMTIAGGSRRWARLSELARAWLHRSRSRRALAVLDDRLLSDLGLTAAEALRESEKPFWRA